MSNTLNNQTIKDGSFMGSTDLTDVKAEELSIMGPLKFHNLQVTGDSDIMGSIQNSQNGIFNDLSILGALDAEGISCRQLDVAGSVKVAGLIVTGDANILGFLDIKAPRVSKYSNQLQNLKVSGETISLEDTTVNGDVTVHPTLKNKALKWFKDNPNVVVHLLGKTTIKGNINFISGGGKVIVGPNAIVEGKIIGGIVDNG